MILDDYNEIVMMVKTGDGEMAVHKILEKRDLAFELEQQNLELSQTVIEQEEHITNLETIHGEVCPDCGKPYLVCNSKSQFSGADKSSYCILCGYITTQMVG